MTKKKVEKLSTKNTEVDKAPDAPLPEVKVSESQKANVAPRKAPPTVTDYEYLQKEEELFALIIAKGRNQARSGSEIIEEWQVLKKTLNEGNIDLYIADNRLRALAYSNRTSLGINPDAATTGVQMLLDRLK